MVQIEIAKEQENSYVLKDTITHIRTFKKRWKYSISKVLTGIYGMNSFVK